MESNIIEMKMFVKGRMAQYVHAFYSEPNFLVNDKILFSANHTNVVFLILLCHNI